MRHTNGWVILAAAVALTLSTGICRADLLQGCTTCQGSTYLLTYDPTPLNTFTYQDPTHPQKTVSGNIYEVYLTIDPTLSTLSPVYINAVAIKISDSVDPVDNGYTRLIAAPGGIATPGGIANWTLENGGLSDNGCQGSGNGYVCAEDGLAAPIPVGSNAINGKYVWEFHYATTSNLALGLLASNIKVEFTDGTRDKQGHYTKVGNLVSEVLLCRNERSRTGE